MVDWMKVALALCKIAEVNVLLKDIQELADSVYPDITDDRDANYRAFITGYSVTLAQSAVDNVARKLKEAMNEN